MVSARLQDVGDAVDDTAAGIPGASTATSIGGLFAGAAGGNFIASIMADDRFEQGTMPHAIAKGVGQTGVGWLLIILGLLAGPTLLSLFLIAGGLGSIGFMFIDAISALLAGA